MIDEVGKWSGVAAPVSTDSGLARPIGNPFFEYARPLDEPRPRVVRAGTVPASGIASDATAMVMTMTSWIRDRGFRFRNELEVVGHRVRGSTPRLSTTPRGTAPRDDGPA